MIQTQYGDFIVSNCEKLTKSQHKWLIEQAMKHSFQKNTINTKKYEHRKVN